MVGKTPESVSFQWSSRFRELLDEAVMRRETGAAWALRARLGMAQRDRKAVQEALALQERELAAMLDAVNEMLTVWQTERANLTGVQLVEPLHNDARSPTS